MNTSRKLSPEHQKSLLKLGAPKGWGSYVEPSVLADLTRLGLIEVRSTDRRTVLTTAGREVYRELVGGPK